DMSRPLPENAGDDRWYSHMPVKVLSARQLLASLATATGVQAKGPAMRRGGRKGPGAKSLAGTGGDPLVRFFDTREPDDDATEFAYGIPQLLRLMNGPLTNASARVARQLANKHKADRTLIEEIYLAALSPNPALPALPR